MSFFHKIDLFGIKKEFKIIGKNKFSTKLSVFFSILVIIIFTFKMGKMLINSFITKNSYNQKITFKTSNKIQINLSTLKMAFCSLDKNNNSIEWDYNFGLNYKIKDKLKNEFIFEEMNNKCAYYKNLPDFIPFYKTNDYDFDNCLCLKLDKNYLIGEELGILEIYVYLKDQSVKKMIDLTVAYTDYYFDYDQYPNPIQPTVEYLYSKIGGEMVVRNTYYINKLSYDDTSFDYEFFYYKGEIKQSFLFSDKSFTSIEPSIDENRCVYTFKSNKKDNFFEISFFSFDTFFAACGGLFQLFSFIFHIISDHFNDYYLDKNIMKIFSQDIKSVNMNSVLLGINPVIDIKFNSLKDYIFDQNLNDKNLILKSDLNIYNKRKYLKKLLNKFYDACDIKNFYYLYVEFNVLKKILFNQKNMKLFNILSKCDLLKTMDKKITGFENHGENCIMSKEISEIMTKIISDLTCQRLENIK